MSDEYSEYHEWVFDKAVSDCSSITLVFECIYCGKKKTTYADYPSDAGCEGDPTDPNGSDPLYYQNGTKREVKE